MRKKFIYTMYIRNPGGFSFVELILYMGLISIFLYAAVGLTWNIIYSREKTDTQMSVAQAVRFASSRITSEVRRAQAIESINTTSLSLTMADPTRNPTIIDLHNDRIRLRFGPDLTCGPAAECYLTPTSLMISTLSFINLTVLEKSSHVRFTITADALGDRQEFEKTLTITSSAELRNYAQ